MSYAHCSVVYDVVSCPPALYGLRVVKASGMRQDCLFEVFRCAVLTKLLYVSPAWSGFCSAADINQLDRFLNRSKRFGNCCQTTPSIIIRRRRLIAIFITVLSDNYHVLHRLLPENKSVSYNFRSRCHNLTYKSTFYDDGKFITRMIFLAMFTNSTYCRCFVLILLVTMRCV